MAKSLTVQASAPRAIEVLPGELHVGPITLKIFTERENGTRNSRRFRARWYRGTGQGEASVEITHASKSTSEITVTLHPPMGMSAHIGLFLDGTARMAGVFTTALAYEIETRTSEESDAFAVRRTTPELVRQRSA